MTQRKSIQRPSGRLQVGKAVLAAASVVDTSLVANRLAKFAAVHELLEAAQRTVDAHQKRFEQRLAKVGTAEAALSDALDELIYALLAERRPRQNPLAPYGNVSSTSIARMKPAERSVAVEHLVAELARDTTLSPATVEAVDTVRRSARNLNAALEPVVAAEAALRDARSNRDRIADDWDDALRALRRGSRIAADEGAPHLYSTLFGRTARPAPRAKAQPATSPHDDPSSEAA